MVEAGKYWDIYYPEFLESRPSSFCTYLMENFLQDTDSVIEIGCGNGRDGLHLAKIAKHYLGIDSSISAIKSAQILFESAGLNPRKYQLLQQDFADLELPSTCERLIIYSRFSLHADTEYVEDRLLKKFIDYKSVPILVAVEARTIFDELFGKGKLVGKNSYLTDHFRRFLDPIEFQNKISSDFTIIEFQVKKGFATYKNEDPKVMRVIFSKNTN